MDYPKLISEKWNLTAKFNCLQAIYFDAPSALAVPMCGLVMHIPQDIPFFTKLPVHGTTPKLYAESSKRLGENTIITNF